MTWETLMEICTWMLERDVLDVSHLHHLIISDPSSDFIRTLREARREGALEDLQTVLPRLCTGEDLVGCLG